MPAVAFTPFSNVPCLSLPLAFSIYIHFTSCYVARHVFSVISEDFVLRDRFPKPASYWIMHTVLA